MTGQEFAESICKHLKRFKIKCPICQDKQKHFKIIGAYTRFPALANPFMQTENVIPAITICCSKCGHFIFFDPEIIFGALEKKETPLILASPDQKSNIIEINKG